MNSPNLRLRAEYSKKLRVSLSRVLWSRCSSLIHRPIGRYRRSRHIGSHLPGAALGQSIWGHGPSLPSLPVTSISPPVASPFPFPPLFSPFLPSSCFPFPPFPFSSYPLPSEVGPLNTATGLGERCKLAQRSEAEP